VLGGWLGGSLLWAGSLAFCVGDWGCIGACWGVAGGVGDWGLVLDGGGCLWWSPGIVIDVMAESKIIQEVEEASFDALELPC